MEKLINVLDKYVNKSCPLYSPFIGDTQVVVSEDEDGVRCITRIPVDNSEIVASLGPGESWQLDSLLKAGVDPHFSIMTVPNTRLSGFADLQSISSQILAKVESAQSDVSDSKTVEE